MLLALALTACASKPAAPTAADFEVQPGEYRYQDSDIFFVETEKGNYYMNPSGDGLIHFTEPGSHEFHVLCNKPNCGHASADCNAFLEVAFGYYNGHLYGVTLQDHFELIQMDMDGTNHRVITQLPEQKDLSGNFNGGGSYFFDNVLYYHRAGVGLCEYDKATGTETVKVPMDVYYADVSYTKDYIFLRTVDSADFNQCVLLAYDRDYNLLGKLELEKIGLRFPFLEYTTANAIYLSTDGGTITHYIDPHHLDRLELIQLVDPTARSHG